MTSPAQPDEAEADAAFWGLILPDAHPDEDRIWRENLPALEAFLSVSTQWNVIALATGEKLTVGLNYANAKVGLECAGIELTADLWNRLQHIEQGAMGALNEA